MLQAAHVPNSNHVPHCTVAKLPYGSSSCFAGYITRTNIGSTTVDATSAPIGTVVNTTNQHDDRSWARGSNRVRPPRLPDPERFVYVAEPRTSALRRVGCRCDAEEIGPKAIWKRTCAAKGGVDEKEGSGHAEDPPGRRRYEPGGLEHAASGQWRSGGPHGGRVLGEKLLSTLCAVQRRVGTGCIDLNYSKWRPQTRSDITYMLLAPVQRTLLTQRGTPRLGCIAGKYTGRGTQVRKPPTQQPSRWLPTSTAVLVPTCVSCARFVHDGCRSRS